MPQADVTAHPPNGHGRQSGPLATGQVFVRIYCSLALSGLLARLSGAQLKVLLALALEGWVLGDGPQASSHFARLQELGVVAADDRGRLFCYLDRDTLARRTGLSPRSVSSAVNALVASNLVEKRSVRNHHGQHDYNVYFVEPASHIGKFDFNQQPSDQAEAPEHPHGQDLPTAEGPEPRHGQNRPMAAEPEPYRGQNPPTAEGPEPRRGQNLPTVAETDPPALESTPPPAIPAGALPPAGVAGTPAGDDWTAALEHLYQDLQKAGLPVDESLRLALRAKVVRVHNAARQWGADGSAWVGEAMLLALGRRTGKNGSQPATDQNLLAYADGILRNWQQNGRPRPRAKASHMRTEPGADAEAQEWLPAQSESHLLHPTPRTKEDELWADCLTFLKATLPADVFNLWLASSRLLKLVQTGEGTAHLVVAVPSDEAVYWLERRLKPAVDRAVRCQLKLKASITFQAPSESLIGIRPPNPSSGPDPDIESSEKIPMPETTRDPEETS
jgi:hypothetical protein